MYLVINESLNGSGEVFYFLFHHKQAAESEISMIGMQFLNGMGVDAPTMDEREQMSMTSDFRFENDEFYFVDELRVTLRYVTAVDKL